MIVRQEWSSSNFLINTVLDCKGGISIPRCRIIYRLNACNMMSKGYLYQIVRVNDLESNIPNIELVPVVSELSEVFHSDLS